MIGEIIGSYRIVRKLGEGGMGVVYAAEHQVLGRRAAIKVLLPEYSQNQEMLGRIFNEARATALIEHPGLVDIYDYGQHTNGSAYIVMEYLEGESLATRLHREHRLPVDLVASLGRQIASAVGVVHHKGIIHRDLKPDNVFLVRDDEVASGVRAKVLDFGIAKLAGDGQPGSMKTRTGMLMGTPVYMSPEQCRGAGAVDLRADIYSLGCMIYEMACGRPPFVHEGMGEIIAAQLYGQPPRPSDIEPSVPPWLETILLRSLAKRPEDRQQSMDQMASELGGLSSNRVPAFHASFPTIALDGPPPGMWPTPGPTRLATQPPQYQPLPGTVMEHSLPPHAVGTKTTTLSRTASEIVLSDVVRPKRSRGLWVGVAAAVVAGGVVAAVLASRGSSKQGTPANGPVAAGDPPKSPDVKPAVKLPVAPEVKPAVVPEVKPAVVPDVKPPEVKPAVVPDGQPAVVPEVKPPDAKPATVKLTIASDPPGAGVFRAVDGIKVGVTPLVQELPRTDGLAVFHLKKSGYKDLEVELSAADDGSLTKKLEKVSHHPVKVVTKPDPPEPKNPTNPTKKKKSINNGALDPFGGN